MKWSFYFVMWATWVFGIAIAKGFWMTAFSFICPVVAWVICTQWMIERFK